MSSIKNKLALFIAKRKYLMEKNSSQNFKGLISNSSKILIVLPNTAEDILKCFDIPVYFKNHKKEVVLFLDEKFRQIVQQESQFDIISYTDNSLTKLRLPNKSLSKKLSELEFDVVLDLNREDDLFLSIIANIPKSALVAGFKKEKADELYNLQIANNQNNAEISYGNFLNSIQMF